MIKRIKNYYTYLKWRRKEKKKWLVLAKAMDISPSIINFVDFKASFNTSDTRGLPKVNTWKDVDKKLKP